MNKKQRAILYGLAIGDGHISYRTRLKDGKYRYEQAELIIGHSPKQKEYLEHKVDLIHSIFGGKKPKVSEVRHNLNNGKTYIGYRSAKTHKYFRQMHRALYSSNKKKVLTRQVLNYLDEQSLALWFCDDGSMTANHNKLGDVTSVSFRICTQFITEDEAKLVTDWFKEVYDLDLKYFSAKGKFDIGGNTQQTLRFIDLIIDYIPNSMFYKTKHLARLTICKSARHPHFYVDDDIVRSVKNKIDSAEEVNSLL